MTAPRAALTYSAMHEQEGTIQLFAAATCPKITGAVPSRQNTSPNNLPPNMAANDLRCSEMPHYCRVVIRV